jgi:phage tail tape-measure protein
MVGATTAASQRDSTSTECRGLHGNGCTRAVRKGVRSVILRHVPRAGQATGIAEFVRIARGEEVVMARRKNTTASKISARHRIEHEAEGAASGAFAGGVVGVAAGPAGIAAGAVIGGIAGVIVGAVLDQEASRSAIHDDEIDTVIGVIGGDIGAPSLQHVPADVGTCSLASAGVAPPGDDESADGPFQVPES